MNELLTLAHYVGWWLVSAPFWIVFWGIVDYFTRPMKNTDYYVMRNFWYLQGIVMLGIYFLKL